MDEEPTNELAQYMQGKRVARQDRNIARRAKSVHDEVRLAGFKADGALALAGHIMEGITGLDEYRRSLAKGDPLTNTLLADIEQQALLSVKKIQANLYSAWNM